MEENNNNDNRAVETIKNVAKDESKKLMKSGAKKILKFLLPILANLLLCLLTVGVIMAAVYSVINFFKGLLGLDADAEASATVLEESQRMISITDQGYKLNDEYSKKILEELESQMVDIEAMGYTDKDLTDMIDKYIKAELKTMYPTIGKGKVDGLVKIQRMSAETGEVKQLTYLGYEEFKNKVSQNKTDVLDYFSLNPDTFELCIAISETTINYDYNNVNKKELSRISTISMREIEYQSTLQRYATPFNYFITMHNIVADKDFMNELLDMVNSETDIVLTFLESTYKEFLQVDYDGVVTTVNYETEEHKTEIKVPIEDEEQSEEESEEESDQETNYKPVQKPTKNPMIQTTVTNRSGVYDSQYFAATVPAVTEEESEDDETEESTEEEEQKYKIEYITEYITTETGRTDTDIDAGNVSTYSQYIMQQQYLIETTHNSGDLYVTKANTWRLKSELNIQVNEKQIENTQIDNITKEIEIDESDTKVTDRAYTGSYREGWIKEITNEWTESYDISINETAEGYDLTNFMNLIYAYPKVRNNLETSPSLLFYLLEENENTQELASVMKYVIYSLTEIDYGVNDLDSIFSTLDFAPINQDIVAAGGDFIEIAKVCHDYIANNKFFYSSEANKKAGRYVKDGTSTGNGSIPYPNGTQYIDCSAYVSWVLYEYGYTEFEGYQKSSSWFMGEGPANMGWGVLPASQAQPGDLLVKNGHIEIYVGNGTYGAGSTNAIRSEMSYVGCSLEYIINEGGFTRAIRVEKLD